MDIKKLIPSLIGLTGLTMITLVSPTVIYFETFNKSYTFFKKLDGREITELERNRLIDKGIGVCAEMDGFYERTACVWGSLAGVMSSSYRMIR